MISWNEVTPFKYQHVRRALMLHVASSNNQYVAKLSAFVVMLSLCDDVIAGRVAGIS
jgi:hypothetical protein